MERFVAKDQARSLKKWFVLQVGDDGFVVRVSDQLGSDEDDEPPALTMMPPSLRRRAEQPGQFPSPAEHWKMMWLCLSRAGQPGQIPSQLTDDRNRSKEAQGEFAPSDLRTRSMSSNEP